MYQEIIVIEDNAELTNKLNKIVVNKQICNELNPNNSLLDIMHTKIINKKDT